MSSPERRVPTRRVGLVADELLGYVRDGLGTTTTFLAVALARMGHRVEVLYLGPRPVAPIDPEWGRLYDGLGIRVRPVPRGEDVVEPAHFARMAEVMRALHADPPDVVVVQDLGAPAYTALRLRRLGLAFESTSFVVLCHGTRQWTTDVARKVRVLPGAHAITVLERASVELADVVVSPSAYMLEWMRGQRWCLPEQTFVIPHVTRSGATGERPPEPACVDGTRRVERIAFFGRLEERKGLRPFVAALNALEPELLATVELEFIGRPTAAWPPERVDALLSRSAKQALRRVSFETTLDQHEALARLSQAGTLVVMPSLEDNSPNAVYECLERGIPFIASDVGGAGELVAEQDRGRVLFEPTPEAIEDALRRALSDVSARRPARSAFTDADSLQGWAEVVELSPPSPAPLVERPRVEAVVVHRGSRDALARCLSALGAQTYRELGVTVALAGTKLREPEGLVPDVRVVRSERASVEAAREAALQVVDADWVCFLDEEDVPEDALVETLVRAQAASGADVVTCGHFLSREGGPPSLHLFAGQPRGHGMLSNGYGNVALLRRSLLGELTRTRPAEGDVDWPLLAGLSAGGARIVSVPAPLVTRTARPGTLETHPSDALLVIEQLEGALPEHVASLARLAAGLAADAQRQTPAAPTGFARRAARRLAKSFR